MDAKTTAANLFLDYLNITGAMDKARACAIHAATLVHNEYELDLDPGKHLLWKEVIKHLNEL